jgi:hypothetical protein
MSQINYNRKGNSRKIVIAKNGGIFMPDSNFDLEPVTFCNVILVKRLENNEPIA